MSRMMSHHWAIALINIQQKTTNNKCYQCIVSAIDVNILQQTTIDSTGVKF